MPFSIKKQLKTVKRELSKFLPSTSLKSTKAHNFNDETLTTFRNIRNDLNSRNRYKDEKNANRDYTKLCDKILLQQNNCALRCAQEKKVSNLSRSECLVKDQKEEDNFDKCDRTETAEEPSNCDSRLGGSGESELVFSFVLEHFICL